MSKPGHKGRGLWCRRIEAKMTGTSRDVGRSLQDKDWPAIAGHTALTQHIAIHSGDSLTTISAVVEENAGGITMAGLSFGIGLGRARWNGAELSVTGMQYDWGGVPARSLLRDFLYSVLPASVVRQSLPDGWLLRTSPGGRTLHYGDELVLRIDFAETAGWAGARRIENLRDGYTLRIDSKPL